MTWSSIEPMDVAKEMSFVARTEGDTPVWSYGDSAYPVANLQAEGVAGITSILAREPDGVAILADEVGMGKTVQAIGIMTMLWKRKANAKVLVVVPKSHLTGQWKKEYAFFRDKMLRRNHGLPEFVEVKNLQDLVNQRNRVRDDEPFLFATRLSVFSNLTKGRQEVSSKSNLAREIASSLRKACRGFDLLVFDEAHYLRTKEGGSQRVAAVDAFLGRDQQAESRALAEKTLLMTGTPNHSSNDDVKTVLKYFVPDRCTLLEMKPGEILSRIAVRRLRKLAGRSKYQYREESECACSFPDDPAAEIYFALYQRGLAHLVAKDTDGKTSTIHKHEQRRFLYGYLEGFESLSVMPETPQSEVTPDAREIELKDYHRADDTDVLRSLAALWGGAVPEHPKYDGTMEEIIPDVRYWNKLDRAIESDKHLVFVRRIPSCHEMVTRVNARYDRLMLGKILRGSSQIVTNETIDSLLRSTGTAFRQALDHTLKLSMTDESETSLEGGAGDLREDVTDKVVPSRVMDYFRTHSNAADSRDRYSSGSRFRKRFEAKESPFRPFFTWSKEGNGDSVLTIPKTFADIYLHSIQGNKERLKEWDDLIAWIGQDEEQGKAFFERFLRKGILLASPGIVELFAWFIEAGERDGFDGFCCKVRDDFHGSICQRLTARAIACYLEFVTKFVSQERDEIESHEWNHFNSLDPAEFCSGEVGEGARERLIHAFNSPFFPNVLVATSVFQEGVNLHYHCRNVMHYGIAWTPGDNEQRVGRVDRLQGAVERSIQASSNAEAGHLNINYPYLQGTFDEDQLGQFIVRKRAAEDVLDLGEVLRPDKHIDPTQGDPDWRSQFRKPASSRVESSKDPYPWPRP